MVPGFFQARLRSRILSRGTEATKARNDAEKEGDSDDAETWFNSDKIVLFASNTDISLAKTGNGSKDQSRGQSLRAGHEDCRGLEREGKEGTEN